MCFSLKKKKKKKAIPNIAIIIRTFRITKNLRPTLCRNSRFSHYFKFFALELQLIIRQSLMYHQIV